MREPIVPEFDAETYLMWESRQRERFELHYGFVVAFAGGTLDHDHIAFNARIVLNECFLAPCRTFGSDVKVRVGERNFYYPDAGVLCAEHAGEDDSVSDPAVVLEVLSPSTRAYDLIDKRAAYRSLPTLIAYVVVHADRRRIEVDLRDATGAWFTTVSERESIPLGNGALTLDAVYARTSLAAP